jgi:hypothetical protein
MSSSRFPRMTTLHARLIEQRGEAKLTDLLLTLA